MPDIISLKEAYADLRGGAVSGETVLITGENIDTSLVGNDRVIITIDGEKATITGKVSADGKTVTITPPPGTLPGKTMLQLINEDGSMDQMEFEYKRIITAPKIIKIVPTKGGNGTKLVIKGEDFLLPDDSVMADD
ncbi:MAG: cell surface receptor and fibronectin protein, partial [Clostridia bacterium]|nr:cell surface receptor and fibronectin protein [Clostridia bacterium]